MRTMTVGATAGLESTVCQLAGAAKVLRRRASAYCVLPLGKSKAPKTGEWMRCGTSVVASRTDEATARWADSKEREMGTTTVGMVVVPPFEGAPPTSVSAAPAVA